MIFLAVCFCFPLTLLLLFRGYDSGGVVVPTMSGFDYESAERRFDFNPKPRAFDYDLAERKFEYSTPQER